MLDGTDSMVDLMTCIDNVVDHVNVNGGFTVVGWHKRGQINDQSASGDTNEAQTIQAGDVTYHMVSVEPTDDTLTHAHPDLTALKFRVDSLNGA